MNVAIVKNVLINAVVVMEPYINAHNAHQAIMKLDGM